MALTWTPLANLPSTGGYWSEGGIAGIGNQLWMTSYRLNASNGIAVYDITADSWSVVSPDADLINLGLVADADVLWLFAETTSYVYQFTSFNTTTQTFRYYLPGSR
jgi:hypothetical protein